MRRTGLTGNNATSILRSCRLLHLFLSWATTDAQTLLDRAETAGIANLKERNATLTMLRGEASTALGVVVIGRKVL